jgi:two-component system NarL family sensor kinase
MTAHNTSNNTNQELLLKQLTSKNELLQSILDTSLIGMSVLQAERNNTGIIDDFRIVIVSKELQRLTGRSDLSGKLYSKEYPGIRQTPLFNLMLQVMETGVAAQIEYPYQVDGFNSWFSSMFVKMGDGLVASNLDITERKHAEEDRVRTFTLLEQTEELAGTGSWEYDCITHLFTWSKGMCRIFGADVRVYVTPETFLYHATEDTRFTASLIAEYIVSGQRDFEETIKIIVENTEKDVIVKGSVVRDQDNRPLRVIGVNMDITRQVKLQKEKEQFELQQRAFEIEQKEQVFKADLNAQEDERRRIAESLHNGIGQLLYAVKMNLNMVDLERNPDSTALYQIKQATEQLLVEAIRESRRVSHALTPIILEEFGLKAALEDLCKNSDKEIAISYCFKGTTGKVDRFIEISVYRMVQELTSNVLKYAGATKVTLIVEHQPQCIVLTVLDESKAFSAEKVRHQASGLKTIENKVRLLKGSLEVKSEDRAEIKIHVPFGK